MRPLLFACALALAGCGSSALQLRVEALDEANGGRPVRMLVRKVDDVAFTSETYESVATRVIASDPSVLASEIVYPGTAQTVKVERPEKGSVGVYFFFTRPSGEWKLFLSPVPSGAVKVRLREGWIEAR